MINKKQLRKELLAIRSAISIEDQKQFSTQIVKYITSTEWYHQAEWIFTYIPFRDEVNLYELFEFASKMNKRIAIPKTDISSKKMDLFEYRSMSELIIGNYGILEPVPERSIQVDPSEIHLMLVPGVAFDRSGFRLGYGGGYYDRFISNYPHIPRIGVAYDCQLVDEIEAESHDQPMNAVVTEKGVFPFIS